MRRCQLFIPAIPDGGWPDLATANSARSWCAEINARTHSETYAVPIERLASEREILRPLRSLRPPLRAGERRTVDRRGSVRSGSARYLVPESLVGARVDVAATEDKLVIHHGGAEIVRHDPVGPGEVAFGDFADPKRRPTRAIRPRTSVEVAFLGLGPAAELFLRSAAAAGTLRLESELAGIVELVPIWGMDAVMRALGRAARFRRFKAADVRAILNAGRGLPTPARAGQQLTLDLPVVPVRSLGAYALVQGGLL